MKDRELLTQLNKLSEITPSRNWKSDNRNILISQISGQSSDEKGYSFFKLSLQIITSLSQPAMVVVLLFVIIGAIGIKFNIGENTKPGDSLYIAKRISERTRSSLVFNEKEKMQLGIQFAKNRVEEIEKVLAGVDNDKDVDELVYDFNNEIAVARDRIGKFYTPSNNVVGDEDDENNNENEDGDIIEDEEEVLVFSANSDKQDSGVSITDSKVVEEDVVEAPENTEEVQVSSTDEIQDSPHDILGQVEELIEQEDYEAALEKLDEASDAVENISNVEEVEETEVVEEVEIDEVKNEEVETVNTGSDEELE
ncbi:hypothetical protein KAI92_03635 [Candidatus Parcubacteria bacterium]|nr:hypothetical protein [Candidatus Parcubacteria bacterium]